MLGKEEKPEKVNSRPLFRAQLHQQDHLQRVKLLKIFLVPQWKFIIPLINHLSVLQVVGP